MSNKSTTNKTTKIDKDILEVVNKMSPLMQKQMDMINKLNSELAILKYRNNFSIGLGMLALVISIAF